jgi:hypothetical protein
VHMYHNTKGCQTMMDNDAEYESNVWLEAICELSNLLLGNGAVNTFPQTINQHAARQLLKDVFSVWSVHLAKGQAYS